MPQTSSWCSAASAWNGQFTKHEATVDGPRLVAVLGQDVDDRAAARRGPAPAGGLRPGRAAELAALRHGGPAQCVGDRRVRGLGGGQGLGHHVTGEVVAARGRLTAVSRAARR